MRVAYWVRGEEYQKLAELSIESVRRVYPNARIEIVTDDGTRPAMVANLDAQLSVIARAAHDEPILFLDVDTLLRRVFPFNADLTVTWRDHVKHANGEQSEGIAALMPYNYGVVGVKASERIYEAFLWMRARVLEMGPRQQAWYGNQLALAALVGARPNEGHARKSVHIRWAMNDPGATVISIEQLPCEVWNYTPQAEGEDVSEKAIVHLKGNRKDLMAHYARCA